MAALKKLVEPAIENAVDFLKSFSKKSYYHGSDNPNIKKFDVNKPQVSSNMGETNPLGATYFTPDLDYAEGYALQSFDNFYNKIPIEKEDLAIIPGPMKKSDVKKRYKGTYFRDFDEQGRAPTVYEVKIKDSKKNIFDPNNEQHVSKFKKALPKDSNLHDITDMLGEYEYLEKPEVSQVIKDLGYRGYISNETSPSIGLFYPNEDTIPVGSLSALSKGK
jgi:hypothetical protein